MTVWEVIVRFVTGFIPSIAGFYIINNITNKKETLFKAKHLFLVALLGSTSIFSYKEQYNIITPLITFCLTIIIYKPIFHYSWAESILNSTILMTFIAIGEILVSIILAPIIDLETFREDIVMQLKLAPTVAIIAVVISKITIIKKQINNLNIKMDNNKIIQGIIFILIALISVLLLFYILVSNYSFNIQYIICLICCIIFIALDIIYLQERKEYGELSQQYDLLLNYVNEFSEWMEEEQLDKHEYKNNLAVLKTKVTNQEAIDFIEEKLTGKMKVDESWGETLKNMPQSSLKGLVFYKIVLAKNYNVNLIIDVSATAKEYFKKLSNKDYKDICYLFGIYADNALEAAIASEQKDMAIEIYGKNNQLHLVISNSYTGEIKLDQISTKGYTTKGTSHGKGLSFAQRVLRQNRNIKETHKLCGTYFIEEIIIIPK